MALRKCRGTASAPADISLYDTYFVVVHFYSPPFSDVQIVLGVSPPPLSSLWLFAIIEARV